MMKNPKFEEIIVRGIIEKKHRKENNLERFAQIRKSLDVMIKQQKR